MLIPYVHNFIIHTGIPICEPFSDPCTFAYGDPHMHMAITVWENTHMGIQDLISHMEIFPVCIRLVTEISPYAYGDCTNPRMHTGITCHAIPVCIRGSLRSPYAYGDWFWSLYAYGDCMTCNPRMHTGIELDPRMHTGISCFGRGVCMLCIRKILIHCTTHVKILIQCVTRGKTADVRNWSPYAYEESPYANVWGSRKIRIWGVPVRIMKLCAYGD